MTFLTKQIASMSLFSGDNRKRIFNRRAKLSSSLRSTINTINTIDDEDKKSMHYDNERDISARRVHFADEGLTPGSLVSSIHYRPIIQEHERRTCYYAKDDIFIFRWKENLRLRQELEKQSILGAVASSMATFGEIKLDYNESWKEMMKQEVKKDSVVLKQDFKKQSGIGGGAANQWQELKLDYSKMNL